VTRTSTTCRRRSWPRCLRCGVAGGGLDALEEDHEFLLAGGVFTEELIETGSPTSDAMRWTPCACAPPWEFKMYYDL